MNNRYLFLFVSLLILFAFQVVSLTASLMGSAGTGSPDAESRENDTDRVDQSDRAGRAGGDPSLSAAFKRSLKPEYHLEEVVEGPGGYLYAVSTHNGFLVSFNGGRSWTARNNGLPRKVVYPFEGTELRHLTSVGVDPVREGRIAVTTARELYLSEDYGLTWEQIPARHRSSEAKGWPKPYTYFTSVALSPEDRDRILVGTSFDGFYETLDRGRTWRDPSEKAFFLIRGANFYEEVTAIAYDPSDPERLLLGCGFGKGVFGWDPVTQRHADLAFPGSEAGEVIETMIAVDDRLRVTTDRNTWIYTWEDDSSDGTWRIAHYPSLEPSGPYRPDPDRDRRIAAAADKTGIYVNAYGIGGSKIDLYLNFLREHGLNSIVVDFKDDYGIVCYDTELELPYELNAVKPYFDARRLIEKAHDAGIYVIARILVFKDRAMYRFNNHEYAAWDRHQNWAWANLFAFEDEETGETGYYQKEHWVDPFSPFVWRYNVAIAEELQELGVDEIQFDYIRFPTDGNLSAVAYRHRRKGMERQDALESFLRLAREVIHIPISTDLYGFNSWHRMGNWNGQSIEMVCNYVDVIAPMFYPSHFSSGFLRSLGYNERAKTIYREGTERAQSIVANRSIVRPYVQAFLIGKEGEMDSDRYSFYLRKQLEGVRESPASGYTLWNAGNNYYMVTFPLAGF